MTYDKVQEVVGKYLTILGAHDAEKDSVCTLCHVKWMLKEMSSWSRGTVKFSYKDKLQRWLGFVQGVFYVEDIYSIDEMREHNRE